MIYGDLGNLGHFGRAPVYFETLLYETKPAYAVTCRPEQKKK